MSHFAFLALAVGLLQPPAQQPAQQAAPAAVAQPPQAEAVASLRLPAIVCGQTVPVPAKLPPTGSGPVVYALMLCFEKQGGSSVIDQNTYLYYLQVKDQVSRPSQDRWVPYTDTTEQTILGDFKRLWATSFLDDLAIDV